MLGFFLDQKIVNAHECAKVIYKIFNAPRVHHESTTSAPRVHHDCTESAPRVHQECTTMAPRVHQEFLCRTFSLVSSTFVRLCSDKFYISRVGVFLKIVVFFYTQCFFDGVFLHTDPAQYFRNSSFQHNFSTVFRFFVLNRLFF